MSTPKTEAREAAERIASLADFLYVSDVLPDIQDAIDTATATDKATIADLTAQLKTAMEERDTRNDFMAFMSAELSTWPCCHENGEHSDSPPMMWPELIGCIVKKATETALSRAVAAEKERDEWKRKHDENFANDEEIVREWNSMRAERDELRRLADQSASESGLFAKRMGEAQDAERAALKERDRQVIITNDALNGIAMYQEQVAKLTAERDELQKDKARLDWLDSQKIDFVYYNTGERIRPRGDSLVIRTAIDAAAKPEVEE